MSSVHGAPPVARSPQSAVLLASRLPLPREKFNHMRIQMQHRRIASIFAVAGALTLGACSRGEQHMEDSAAAQAGAGTTDAQGAAVPATGTPSSATGVVRDTTADTARMVSDTLNKRP